ncbi:CARDB domain-containing protein [Roseateles cellulosilyticus]|uniref:CARDB domain-containing protein n=1 Tax=Pelomonas cellulosilytica TaxID=2906762 RepID=A0ABS8XTJ4_9BURK|nr:hypothetical protein [Pelomonas sp. P8]
MQGHLLVSDTRHRRIQFAALSTLSGTPSFQSFGEISDLTDPAALVDPQGLAADRGGNVYVVDARRNQVLLFRWSAASATYTADLGFASTTRNSVGGSTIEAPRGVATAADGHVYLLDAGRKRVLRADGPADTSWEVFVTDPSLGNAYGIGVGPDGRVYVADTDHHRIVRYETGGTSTSFGRFGTGAGEFRFPRDVAISDDGRIFVADTGNHRIAVLAADGRYLYSLGRAPSMGFLQKLGVSSAAGAGLQLFAADSDRHAVVAYLGRSTTVPYDGWIRDYVGDTGAQPSAASFVLASPDVLVRHLPDLDATAAAAGLEFQTFQQPRFGQDNYVYLAVRNRGSQEMREAVALLYWADPAGNLAFPADWQSAGIYNGTATSHRLEVPPLAAGASVVLGPLRLRPPPPDSALFNDGAFVLGVRILDAYDQAPAGAGPAAVRAGNNVAVRPIKVARAPFPVGPQDTLVVRADFPDVTGSASEADVRTRVDEVDAWVRTVSYGQARLRPLFVGPITLDHPRAYYAEPTRTYVVDLTSEVLQKVIAANPGILDGPTADADDDIDRVVVVLNDASFVMDAASTGHWPFTAAGNTYHLSASIQGPADTTAQFAHGMLHQFGLKDLYVHDNVNVDPGLVGAASGWDNMAKPINGAHPLVWSKELAGWVTAAGGRINYIRRPPRGAPPRSNEPPVALSYQSTLARDAYGAIAVGLTEGVTTFEEETHFYWIEARRPDLGNDPVPSAGVLVYYANKAVPQGELPVIVRDGTPATATRDDAPLQVNGRIEPVGTGIRIVVDAQLAGDDGYMVRIDYAPPATGYDVSVGTGDPPWTSPDIWVDNLRDGGGFERYDPATFLSDGRTEEQPIAGEVNRVYARVHNAGPATAHDVEVAFSMSEPYHTVGGESDFSPRGVRIIPTIPPGEYRDVYFEWTPVSPDDPHSCVRVALRRLVNDTNDANNNAQQNLSVQESRTHSPYTEVKLDFSVSNDQAQPRLVYFRADDVPRAWTHSLSADRVLLAPGERFVGTLRVKPNDEAPVCRNHDIHMTGWSPRGDTLLRLGGTTLNVALRRTETIDVTTRTSACPGGDDRHGFFSRSFCERITARGCTQPPQPNQMISVRYLDANGQPVWHEVQTDATGCFEDAYNARSGGPWEVTAYYPGDGCMSTATAQTGVVLPPTYGGDGDERRREAGLFIEYLHLQSGLGIRSPWMLGVRYGVGLSANWMVESELSTGTTYDSAGASGRIWQLTGHSILQSRPLGPLGWRVFLLGGVGVVVFNGFSSGATSRTVDLGAGLTVPLNRRVSLRGDLRLVTASSAYGAGVTRNVEATLGLSARF